MARSLAISGLPCGGGDAAQHDSPLDPALEARLRLDFVCAAEDWTEFARDVDQGLSTLPKRLSCRFFYDEAGALLFEEICGLPEYYVTRAEGEILRDRAAEIVREVAPGSALVELGSGSARKTRRLIDACLTRSRTLLYVPIDISHAMLERSARALLRIYPRLRVRAIAAEYDEGLRLLHGERLEPKLIAWLGSSIGNFDRRAARTFLARLATRMGPNDRLLIGFDLRKDPRTIQRAYDDAAGVTARFNRNLLRRANRELGATFDLAHFRHVAEYDEGRGRVAMYLESDRDQHVRIERLQRTVSFEAGERIHTEDSYKYAPSEITDLAAAARLDIVAAWTDVEQRFSLHLFARTTR